MPKKEPEMSYTLLRNYTELFRWKDADGAERKGFNPPGDAVEKERVPFYIRYVTSSGKVEEGMVTCVSVQPERLQRKIRFVASGEIRIVYDYFVMEVDGTRFTTH